MTKIGFQGEQVHTILVASGGIGMAEGMGRYGILHTERASQGEEACLEPLLVHRPVKAVLLGKEPVHGTISLREGIPVLKNQVPDAAGERDIAVGMVLGFTDMDLHGGMADIGTFQMTEFIQAHAGGVKDGDCEPELKAVGGIKEQGDFFRRRDVREIGVKRAEGKLSPIPVLM